MGGPGRAGRWSWRAASGPVPRGGAGGRRSATDWTWAIGTRVPPTSSDRPLGAELDAVDGAALRRPRPACPADRAPDQAAGAEGHLAGHELRGLVGDVLHLLQGGELRRLGEELAGVGRVHRVLVLHLGHQQLQEHVLVGRLARGRRRALLGGASHPCRTCRRRPPARSRDGHRFSSHPVRSTSPAVRVRPPRGPVRGRCCGPSGCWCWSRPWRIVHHPSVSAVLAVLVGLVASRWGARWWRDWSGVSLAAAARGRWRRAGRRGLSRAPRCGRRARGAGELGGGRRHRLPCLLAAAMRTCTSPCAQGEHHPHLAERARVELQGHPVDALAVGDEPGDLGDHLGRAPSA